MKMTLFERYLELCEKEEASGKDMQYGLPDDKKYPMYDKKHVKLAASGQFFNHVEPSKEKELASAIKKKVKEYGMEDEIDSLLTPENKFTKHWTTNEYEHLEESAIDPVRPNRCPQLFTSEDKIIPEVREYILKALEDWKKTLPFEIEYGYIRLVGSLLGYQYISTTDLDVHVRVEVTPEQNKILRDTRPNCMFVPNTMHPLEFSFQMEDENLENAENIYDLRNDEWIKQREKLEVEIPREYITRISKFFIYAIDMALSTADIHKRELQYIKDREIDENYTEEDKIRAIYGKRDDLVEDRDSIKLLKKVFSAIRDKAYNDRSFIKLTVELDLPDDPHYSVNELVVKILDRHGYKDKLNNYLDDLKKIINEIDEIKLPIINGEETVDRDSTDNN